MWLCSFLFLDYAFECIWFDLFPGDWAARGEMICAAAEAVDFGLWSLNHTTYPQYQLGNHFSLICSISFSMDLTPAFCAIRFHCLIFPKKLKWRQQSPSLLPAIHLRNTSQNPGQQPLIFHLLILLIPSIQVIQHDPIRIYHHISANCAQVAHISDLKHLDARLNISGSWVCWRTVCTPSRRTLLVRGDSLCRL